MERARARKRERERAEGTVAITEAGEKENMLRRKGGHMRGYCD